MFAADPAFTLRRGRGLSLAVRPEMSPRMAVLPQLTPSPSDLARELAAVSTVVAKLPGPIFKTATRGKTSAENWRANVALWTAYPDLPTVKLAKGDTAAIAAWLRLSAAIVRALYQPGPKNPSWNPAKPSWPLPTVPRAPSAGSKYGARRPWNQPQTRYHTGTDLGAAAGTPVLAPEAGVVVAPDSGWSYNKTTKRGVKALILRTYTGKTILLGGIRPGSAVVKAGEAVDAGQVLAEIGAYEGGDSMLHFSLYDGELTESQVNARKKWPLGAPPPPGLLDSGPYLLEAAANPFFKTLGAIGDGFDGPGVAENDVEGGELAEGVEDPELVIADAKRNSASPCAAILCGLGDGQAWVAAAVRYYSAGQSALKAAKARASKGKAWTAEAEAAALSLTVVGQFLDDDAKGLALNEVIELNIDACREALAATRTLEAFSAPPPAVASGGGGGALLVVGLLAVGGLTAALVLHKKR